MPKVGELRYISKTHSQEYLDKANDLYLGLGVGVTGEYFDRDPDRLFEALMAAWDYITETTDQEIYNG